MGIHSGKFQTDVSTLTHSFSKVRPVKQNSKQCGEILSSKCAQGIGVEDQEVQTITYKISYKDILYNVGNIANIFLIILNAV